MTKSPILGIVWGCAFLISVLRHGHQPDPRSHPRTCPKGDRLATRDERTASRSLIRTPTTWSRAAADASASVPAIVSNASLPPCRRAGGSPEAEQRLERDVKPGRDDRERVEDHDQATDGHDRRHQALPERRTGQQKPEPAEERQPQVRHAIGQHPRLGIGLIEEDEIPKPPQAEPAIATGVGFELRQGTTEQDPRALGLTDCAREAR